MQRQLSELKTRQKEMTFLLGETLRRLHKSRSVRFFYTTQGEKEEKEVGKFLRLLEYLDDRIRKIGDIYGDDETVDEKHAAGQTDFFEDAALPTATKNSIPTAKATKDFHTALTSSAATEKNDSDLLQDIWQKAKFASRANQRLFEKSLAQLQNGTEREREILLGYVSHLVDKDTLPKVYELALRDKSSSVRAVAMKQATRIKDMDLDRFFKRGVKDPDVRVRMATIKCLGSHPSDGNFEILGDFLKDSDFHIRGLAVTYLGIYFGPAGIEKSLTASTDESPYVRKSLLEMLGVVNPIGVGSRVQNLLMDEDKDVKRAAEKLFGVVEKEQSRGKSHEKKENRKKD